MSKPPLLNIDGIRALLPHRYPMLLVDRVYEASEQEVMAEKLVSANEPYFEGHFPGRPVMPGVLILEALAQAAAIGCLYGRPERARHDIALIGVDQARFRRPVAPGDILRLHTRTLRKRGDRIYQVEATASVAGETACEARMMAAFVDWGESR